MATTGKSRERMLVVFSRLLITLVLEISASGGISLAQNAYDRGTPAESKGGQSGLSTYAQDKIETVNLANGNLNLHIPLVTVGGRGSASYTVALTYNSKLWSANHETEDLTPPGGPPTKIQHYAAVFDDGNLTQPNRIPLGSGWSICKAPAIKVKQVNIDPLTCLGIGEGTRFKYALTKLWIVLPDGSEIAMRDDLTDGAPYAGPDPCNNNTVDRDRGLVWHSADGSGITYIASVVNGFNPQVNNYSGSVFLSDGTRLVIGAGGRCTKMIDRNGNILDFSYDDGAVGGSVTYTDQLGRQVILQATVSSNFEIVGATIRIVGYNGVADRTVVINGGIIGEHLRADVTTPFTIYNSDVGLDGVHLDANPHFDMFYDPNSGSGSDWFAGQTAISGENTVSSLSLLDGRQFQFQYNRFGELAEIIYPGGGVSQIEYAPVGSGLVEAGNGLALMLNRIVTTRKTFSGGVTPESVWTYTRGVSGNFPIVTMVAHQGDATGPVLLSETHSFLALDAEYRTTSGLHASNGTCYEKFENAREFQTTRSTAAGKSETEAKTWAQRASVSWAGEPYVSDSNHGQEQPPNDPRVLTEQSTLESGKVRKTDYTYDQFNNAIVTKEYDLGSGVAGSLLREIDREYFVDVAVNGLYCYSGLKGITTNCNAGAPADHNVVIHQRRLLKSETVKSGSGSLEGYTEYEYDNYAQDSNHAAVTINSNMSQYSGSRFAAFAVQFQPRGNVTSVKRLISGPINGGAYTVAYSQYDEAGNVIRTIDPRDKSTTISYADNFGNGTNPETFSFTPTFPTFAFPTTVTNSLSKTVKTQYDYARGVVTGVKDANSIISTSEHNDNFDRVTRITTGFGLTGADSSITEFTYPTTGSNTTTVTKQLDGTRWMAYKDTYDGFGRAIGAVAAEDGQKAGSASFTISSNRILDGLGRIRFANNPTRGSGASANGWTRNTYDLAGRVVEVASFSGDTQPPDSGTNGNWTGSITTTYGGEVTTVKDQAGKQRRSTVDGLGRLIKIEEMNEAPANTVYATTTYGYDGRGNLSTVTQGPAGGQQTRSFSYDLLSRLTDATNPESGHINYQYDLASNLAQKSDPRSTTTYTYDALNRVSTRVYSGGTPATPSVTYNYDTAINGVGRLASVVTAGVSTYTYTSYDAQGRPTAYSQSTNGQTYAMAATYNNAGMPLTETYPSGRVVASSYDDAGRLSTTKAARERNSGGALVDVNKTYAGSFSYAAHGGVASMQLGNGLFEHTDFNNRLQPKQIGLGTTPTGATSTSVLGLDYSFGTTNNNGNVLSQTITVSNGSGGTVSMIQSYSYDQVNRLSGATETVGGSSQWSQTYSYDVFGNRWVSSSTGYQLSLLTPVASNHINSLNNRLQMGSSHYDPAGNLDIDATGSTFTYDGENRQVTATIINGQPATYSYDGDGHRVMKTVGSGGSAVTTVFVYDAMGKLIAEYRSDSAQPPNGGGTSYLTTDHLGSTRVVTKQDKSVQARYDYLPFGEELGVGIGSRSSAMKYSGPDVTRQKFTSKERDAESGLDYFLARYYSSAQGRFTSPDEFVGGPVELYEFSSAASSNPLFYGDTADPQSLNKYVYCYNNPLIYTDPNGHQGTKRWIKNTLKGALAAYMEDNGLGRWAPKGNQTTTGRVLGHGLAIAQGVVEIEAGAAAVVGGAAEAVVTAPASGTGVGAVVPAAGVATAAAGAAAVVHGGAVLVNTAHNIFNKGGTPPGGAGSKGMEGRTLSFTEKAEFDSFGQRAAAQGLVENPNRTGSWGRIENGRFKEVARIDVGAAGKSGWQGQTHVHIEGGKDHLDPSTKIPGEK